MRVVSFVPIKMNSQRLHNKNILQIGGHPLCWHICNTILRVQGIDELYVYCSKSEIEQYIPQNARLLRRPEWMDGDEVKGFDIYREFIQTVDADIYVLAHTTSPFVSKTSVENALQHVISGENDSAFSARKFQTFAWYEDKPVNYDISDVPRTQDINPIWIETSGFYIFRKEVFSVHNRRIGFNPYIQELSEMEAVDIDEREDYDFACKLADMGGCMNE